MRFDEEVGGFLRAAHQHGLRLIMVGGGAVNFHGYQRHSADIGFWIETSEENLTRLITVLRPIGYEVDRLPETVRRSEQNISIKISPEMEVELITRFNPGCSFEEAWTRSETAEILGSSVARYRVIGLDDLIESKLKAARPKDLLDVQELKRRN